MSKRTANHSGPDDDAYVTPNMLRLELKAFRLEVRLLIVVGLLVTRLHLPATITAGSVFAVIGVTGLKSLLAR